ncbi:hypothetical protein CT0861_13196 [Colletotrichum tofieldiae]|uniref:PD-(D/E)XK nuclease-like domain-containing protein n=1 Tax=Colletotrichum tofieldiae TaxID=708197 RepID=A0A161VYH7_9PEZI|nr:hypothetical protein CT0861_13196 [Colletotrichum tofieldiae]
MSNYTDAISRKVDVCAPFVTRMRWQASPSTTSTFPLFKPGQSPFPSRLRFTHNAQWRLLDRLVGQTDPKMQLPEFMPGKIIQGHEWLFVASTKQGDQVHIGSTATAIGVYQIVCVLQYLKRWIENTY